MKKSLLLFISLYLTGCGNTTKTSEKIMMLMHMPMMEQSFSMTDNPDYDYLVNMIPHHKGAVLSSEEVLKSAKSSDTITIAQIIIADQNREIAEFKSLLEEVSNQNIDYSASYTETSKYAAKKIMDDMMTAMANTAISGNIDEDYLRSMIPHHEGAIDASEHILTISQNPKIQQIASNIIEVQKHEITTINELLKKI